MVFNAMSWGIFLVLTTALSVFVGIVLDRKFGTEPLFMIIFFLLGAASGLWQVKKELNRSDK
jgi:F0F1-type ATP synthase assembly protein I